MSDSTNKSVTIPSLDEELRELSDRDVLIGMKLAMQGERNMTIRVLHHLSEIKRRRLHVKAGYNSLFDYCTRRLKYSSSAAWRRIQSARCIQRYPEVLAMLHARDISLSTITLIAPVLTDRNKALLLRQVRGRSHREVERVVSEYKPARALRDRVQPVRVPASPAADVDRVLFERELAALLPEGVGTAGAGSKLATEQKLFVQFLASEDLMKKFERVKAMLSSRCGEGTFEEVLGIVLAEFLERHSPQERQKRRAKRKAKDGGNTTDRPTRKSDRSRGESRSTKDHCRRRQWNGGNATKASRHIPVAVRDEVFTRDGGRCTFMAPDGTRCDSTRSLQIDHIHPFAAGGSHVLSNLRLLCAKHNRLAAESTLGKDLMRPYWRKE